MPDSSPSRLRTAVTSAFSLLLSVVLHVGLAGPYLVYAMAQATEPELIGEGEELPDGAVGDGLVGNGGETPRPDLITPSEPVRVSMYVPRPPAPEAGEPADAATDAAPAPVTDTPSQSASSSAKSSSSSRSSQSREEFFAERKEAIQAEKLAELEEARGRAENSGVSGKPPRGARKPCDPLEEIVQTGPTSWKVERSIVDYYASHLRELDRQAVTKTMDDENGKPYGVRVYLPRCSDLRSGGLKNGDIITAVNGKKVATLPQAIKTWMQVRNKTNIKVDITRKDGSEVVFSYKIIK